jgi:hypothetical protein
MGESKMVNKPETKMNWRGLRKHSFLNQRKGYAEDLDKSRWASPGFELRF